MNRSGVVDLGALGAPDDGVGDASEHFLGAQLTARARRRTAPTGSDYVGSTIIEIPAGDFRVTELKGMLGRETQSIKINGLRFIGAGSGQTNIIFDPATPGALTFNDYWLNVAFEHMSFIDAAGGSTFLQAYTTHNGQRFKFHDVSWTEEWLYICDLQGNNNNSEWSFEDIATSGMLDTGAFLNIDPTLGSDQFLNFWFDRFKHWSTAASIIRAGKGGHFKFDNLDLSAYGETATLSDMVYVFDLIGNSHSAGVQDLSVNNMRVEAQNVYCGLLRSEWGTGNVTMKCDWSSAMGGYTYGDIIDISMVNVGGPIYTIHDSNLAGGIKITYGSNTYQFAPRIVVRDTIWHQKLTPSEVVTYDETAAGANLTRPAVEFQNCKSDYNYYSDADGYSVWDAKIPWRTPVMPLEERTLKVGTLLGNVKDASADPKVNFPIGAWITAIGVMAPAGTGTEADGGTWAVKTTDGSPVTIATITVTDELQDGYDALTRLAVPYLCDTRAKATVTVESTNVTQSSYEAFLVIKGYW